MLILSKDEVKKTRLGMTYTAVCKLVFQRAGIYKLRQISLDLIYTAVCKLVFQRADRYKYREIRRIDIIYKLYSCLSQSSRELVDTSIDRLVLDMINTLHSCLSQSYREKVDRLAQRVFYRYRQIIINFVKNKIGNYFQVKAGRYCWKYQA